LSLYILYEQSGWKLLEMEELVQRSSPIFDCSDILFQPRNTLIVGCYTMHYLASVCCLKSPICKYVCDSKTIVCVYLDNLL